MLQLIYGKLVWADGSKYEGQYKSGSRDGDGKMVYKDRARYSGQWKKGRAHGEGRFMWPDGRVYVGAFIQGKRTGVGVMRQYIAGKGITRYVGHFKNDKESGFGVVLVGEQTTVKLKYAGYWEVRGLYAT